MTNDRASLFADACARKCEPNRSRPLGRLGLDEIDQMTDAASDQFSAGEWCEAACDALAWARHYEDQVRDLKRRLGYPKFAV